MDEIPIKVENLSKKYQLGEKVPYKALRDELTKFFASPFRKFKKSSGTKKSDDYIWALKNVSFEVKRGEVVGIIGRNGAGKTTLLKVLSRITEPTEGYAEIRGRVGSLLEVATGVHPELTGRENIYLNGAILGMKKREIDENFDAIVSFAEIEKFIDTPLKYYSYGMSMRLSFSVAAHLQPEILLMDEVLAVGDVDFQKKCLGKIGDVARKGRTVLFVSHNMASIINLCQRAILLDRGEIAAIGKAGEVVQQYMGTIRSTGGEEVWADPAQAPGNDLVRLHAVRILQDGINGSTADVDISKEVLIQIEYWNLQEGALLYACIWLRDHIGTPVFASANHKSISLTDDPWYGRPHPVGMFQSVCRIPGNFLNEGLYSVMAVVGKGIRDTQVLEDNVVSFYVHDTGEMRKEFSGGWIGIVRPRLAWETKQIGSQVEVIEYGR